MSATGAVWISLSVMLGDTGQNALWALVGAFLSVSIAVVLDLSGAIDQMRGWRERRTKRKALRRKEKEAGQASKGPLFDRLTRRPVSAAEPAGSATESVPFYIPGKEDLPPEDGSPFRAGLRLLLEGIALMLRGLKEMASLVRLIPWVVVFYMVLIVGAFALKPLILRLGVDEETAEGVLIADLVLLGLTGAWLLTGVRTEKGSILIRCLETVVLAGFPLLAVAFAFAAGNVLYAFGPALIGVIVYVKAFW
jgi:hypothetical protein